MPNLKDNQEDNSNPTLLGDFSLSLPLFPNLKGSLKHLASSSFSELPRLERFLTVNETLLKLIDGEHHRSFLLGAVSDYISTINTLRILPVSYHFAQFEFWLIHFSNLDSDKQNEIRSKITGKSIPRDEYQSLFPIGMGKHYSGSHFVVAHLSPDVDTTVASFWGWVDAFSARIASGMHIWSLPNGPPESPSLLPLYQIVGKDFFTNYANFDEVISLTAADLLTKKNVRLMKGDTFINSFNHDGGKIAILLVDEKGHYCGNWTAYHWEKIKPISTLYKSCCHYLENRFHLALISVFFKPTVIASDTEQFYTFVSEMTLDSFTPIRDSDPTNVSQLNEFLIKILGMPRGIKSSTLAFAESLDNRSLTALLSFFNNIKTLGKSSLFQPDGQLVNDRPLIFQAIHSLFEQLNHAIHEAGNIIERLDIAIKTKHEVLQIPETILSLSSDVDDIRSKMTNHPFLTVTIPGDRHHHYPVGVVRADDIQEQILGTVTMRDFSNFNEVKMASYLNVISIIDHHKCEIKTQGPPTIFIGDVQSCNVLLAEQALRSNLKYSSAGMTKKSIEAQIKAIQNKPFSKKNGRLHRRLLLRLDAIHNKDDTLFISPKREYLEYLTYLHGIIDDTDLLTKVTLRDVTCVVELLNQLKTLQLKKEEEMIDLDDIPLDADFAKNSAKKILQNQEMYSIYRNIYVLKEKEAREHLLLKNSNDFIQLFSDTKVQNGCCRIGQLKLFKENFTQFHEKCSELQKYWLEKAMDVYEKNHEIDLHIQMVTTVASAEEVFHDQIGPYFHRDEVWFWIPKKDRSLHHLIYFLHRFQHSPQLIGNKLEVILPSKDSQIWKQTFENNLSQARLLIKEEGETQNVIAVLTINAGTLNSRKAMISPYLPQLIP